MSAPIRLDDEPEGSGASDPHDGRPYFRSGNAFHQQGDFEQAVAAYRKAIQLDPRDAHAWNNLGKTYKELNRLAEAIAAYDGALKLQPELAVAHCNRAIALLTAGRFEEGLREYEWRWRLFTPRGFAGPLWDGAPLPEGTLFIHAEQGLGDAIQFVRFVRLARLRAARVVLECHPPLRSLFEHCRCADAFITVGEAPPPFAACIPLLSLPLVLGTGLGRVSELVPCLHPPPFDGRLQADPGHLSVGLAWAGNPGHETDTARSLGLEELSPLLDVPGVTFFSLQVPPPPRDQAFLRSRANLVDASPQLVDFRATAALMGQMDLVVSADTAVAHLAGALGKPVWTFVPHAPDWRWQLSRDDTPWYPTMRLFRQPTRGDWRTPIQRTAAELDLFRRSRDAPHGGE